MKSVYHITFFLCLISHITGQLIDLCSNNSYLHENENECLKIAGCCYATIELEPDKGVEDQNYRISNCFKRYKMNVEEMCIDYKRITIEYENNIVSCKCNNEDYI